MPQTARSLQNEMADHIAFFDREGFLILPEFFDGRLIDDAQLAIDQVKIERPDDVVIDDLENGERTVLSLLKPEAVQRHRMKVYDLYLTVPQLRNLALAPPLVPVLWALLGHVPALCNSIYLEKGSAQEPHIDSLYMTPRSPDHLIAAWVALEDTDERTGPLEYFPGSHRIALRKFSDGGYHAIDGEVDDWRAYMHEEVTRAGIRKQRFSARKGDAFIWHANFLHGGATIEDLSRTRKSCIFHYFSESDATLDGYELVPMSGGLWIDRPPQPLPVEVAARLPFSEKYYLARYPDVAAAVKSGVFADGREHYDRYGRREGRLTR